MRGPITIDLSQHRTAPQRLRLRSTGWVRRTVGRVPEGTPSSVALARTYECAVERTRRRSKRAILTRHRADSPIGRAIELSARIE